MRTLTAWTDAVPDHEGRKQVVYDIAWKPDGTLLVAAIGRRLCIYDPADGTIVRQDVAHRGDIYTLSCSRDGEYIASGGADNAVSVWTWDLQQKFTYNHAGSVQALSFNPVASNVLASASEVDFAVWTMSSPSLRKLRTPSKVNAVSWTVDGQYLALGMLSGAVSIRDATGAERVTITRGAPVYDLVWSPARAAVVANPGQQEVGAAAAAAAAAAAPPASVDVLTVACWDSTLSFYQLSPGGGGLTQIGKDRPYGDGFVYPCTVRHFGAGGEYLLVGGSDRRVTLMTRDGIKLSGVAEAGDWVWRAAPRPRSNQVAVATNAGTVSLHNVMFSTVHGLFGDRYAFRDAMTDVVVQHLVTEERVRIKCRDFVKKVAVYRDRLAVQLPDRIIVYELQPVAEQADAAGGAAGAADGGVTKAGAAAAQHTDSHLRGDSRDGPAGNAEAAQFNMHYRVRDRIHAALECNLLVVTSRHVVLCLERKLQLFDFTGVKVREWVLDAVIRYIKVGGGPPGREALLVGLKSGAVLRIFVDNPFPSTLVHHSASVRCLDLSMSRTKLAVVDENAALTVYDVAGGAGAGGGGDTSGVGGDSRGGGASPAAAYGDAAARRDVLFTVAGGANSVAWNSEAEDMLCYSGGGLVSIKTGNFPIASQKLPGFVVGFAGSKVFCLHAVAMQTVDVPQSASLARYVAVGAWDAAYRTACLGVTEADWRGLGDAALSAVQLPVARAAFIRACHMRGLELLHTVEGARRAQLSVALAAGSGPPPAAAATALLLAEVAAFSGRFAEAGRLFLRAGMPERAIDMFSDLRLWGEARAFAAETGRRGDVVAGLLLKQAVCCEQAGDTAAAAEIYCAAGQPERAVALLADSGRLEPDLLLLIRSLAKAAAASAASAGSSGSGEGGGVGVLSPQHAPARKAIAAAAERFRAAGRIDAAREAYMLLGDRQGLVRLLVDAQRWDEALALAVAADASGAAAAMPTSANIAAAAVTAAATPCLADAVHIAKAEALAAQERFEEAHVEFEAGGAPERAARQLHGLLESAIAREQFGAAAWAAVRLAREAAVAARRSHSGTGRDGGEMAPHAARFAMYQLAADVCAAYALVRAFTASPLCHVSADAVFHASRFCVNAVAGGGSTRNTAAATADTEHARLVRHKLFSVVSMPHALYALALTGVRLQCFATVRAAVEPLVAVAVVPPKWADVLDRIALRLQSLPTEDADAFVPMCYRCGAPSPPLTASVEAISRHGIRPAAARLDLSHARDNARANDDGAAGTPPLGIPAAGAFGGDACPRCGHAVVRSSLNFEPLPLVEFVPEEGVEPDEALQLLAEDTINGAVAVGRGGLEGEERGSDGRGWREIHTDAGQRLVLDAQDDASALFLSDPEHAAPASSSKSGDDLFNDCVTASMNASVNPQQRARSPSDSLSLDAVSSHMINGHSHAGTAPGLVSNRPVVLPRAVLRVQNPAHVFVVRALLPSQSDGSGPPTATSSSGAALSARSTTALLGGQQSAMAAPASAWELADPHFRPRYFKNVIPDVAISMCAFCCRFFHQEDFQLEVLKRGGCPFCRASEP